jgi:hypothetical protein
VVQTLLLLPFLNLHVLCDLCGEIAIAFAFSIYYLLATIYLAINIAFAAEAAPTKETPAPSVVKTLLLLLLPFS